MAGCEEKADGLFSASGSQGEIGLGDSGDVNALSAGSCTTLRTIQEAAANTIAERQAVKSERFGRERKKQTSSDCKLKYMNINLTNLHIDLKIDLQFL